MNKKILIKISLTLIFLCGIFSQSFSYYPIVWVVDDDGGGSALLTIQEAVDRARPYDWIIVYPGTYTENVVVNTRRLKIFASDPNNKPVIDASGGVAITINASRITARGFKIHNAVTGININGSYTSIFGIGLLEPPGITAIHIGAGLRNITIENCDLTYEQGIVIEPGSNNILLKGLSILHLIQPPGTLGILNSGNCTIENCVINGYQNGIQFQNNINGQSVGGNILNNIIRNAAGNGLYCAVGNSPGDDYSSVEVTLNGNSFYDCANGVTGDGQVPDPTRANVYIEIENYSDGDFYNCGNNTVELESGYDNVTIEEGSGIPEWEYMGTYAVDELVTYDGKVYKCWQAHTAYAPNWTPPNCPALWIFQY